MVGRFSLNVEISNPFCKSYEAVRIVGYPE